MNNTLAVMVRTLLYGAGLPAQYWSAALLHAVYLYNRRVHRATLRTPFEGFYGTRPHLEQLWLFGARVCVRRTGKRRAKLDRHDFTGIFLGYTATDQNVRYIDVASRQVRSCHHVIFDEAWYLQPAQPPAAQLLYDVGIAVEETSTSPPTAQPTPVAAYPPMAALSKKLSDATPARMAPLPLHLTALPAHAAAATVKAQGDPYAGTAIRSKDTSTVDAYNITRRDLAQVYVSPHP